MPVFDKNEFNEILEESKNKSYDQTLLQPFNYIQQIRGKQVRQRLGLAFNFWLNVPLDKFMKINEIIQMLHNSSLLIDDIQDESVLRRGIPVAHLIYGISRTINSAKVAVTFASVKVLELGNVEAVKIYCEQLLELHRGQGMEIHWRNSLICPTEGDYQLMTIRKTGGLFMLAIKLMLLFSDNKKDFTKLAALLGLYFQIRDDYCNLTSKEYSDQKTYCEDLTEGKFSFPIIHAIQSGNGQEVFDILKQKTQDINVKKHCVSLLENLGSFEYTRETLKALDKEAREEIELLGSNHLLTQLLDDLLDW